jgi:hypothetical protein
MELARFLCDTHSLQRTAVHVGRKHIPVCSKENRATIYFLSRFITTVLLSDRVAVGLSTTNVRLMLQYQSKRWNTLWKMKGREGKGREGKGNDL